VLEDASSQENTPPAFAALDADVSAQSYHFPFKTTAGMDFLELDNITEFYFQDHSIESLTSQYFPDIR
jgi:hypothetical protein